MEVATSRLGLRVEEEMADVKLTPDSLSNGVFIEFPRRTPALPNFNGTYALYTISKYAIDTNTETKETHFIDLDTKKHHLFSDDPDVISAQWLYENQVIWQKSTDGKTELFVGTVGAANKNAYHAGTIDAPITKLTSTIIRKESIALAFSAPVTPDGSLFNPENGPKPVTTAREYEGVRVRYFNKYQKPYRCSLFYTTLRLDRESRKFKLGEAAITNALKGTKLEFPWVTSPFGEGGSLILSPKGVLFTALDPKHPVDRWTQYLWYTAVKTFEEPSAPKPVLIDGDGHGYTGSTTAMAFAPDGSKFAFLKNTDYERDWYCPKRVFIGDVSAPTKFTEIVLKYPSNSEKQWDRWPEDLLWSNDQKTIFLSVRDTARLRLFKIDVSDSTKTAHIPEQLTWDGAIAAMHRLSQSSDSNLLITSTSFIESSHFWILDPERDMNSSLSSLTEHGALLGASRSQISEFTTTNAAGVSFQSWVITPPSSVRRPANGKHPVAFIVHGGPQAAWFDAWSHRWVPILYAAQGYIVVIPNFTGSNSFGESFSDVRGSWGAAPYTDIVDAFAHVKAHIPTADTSRAVLAGGSFGGYMANWIAGQPLAKEFRTLVSHSGIFSVTGMYASQSGYEYRSDMGGQQWEARDLWDKYDPSRYTHNWTQPMLFLHAEEDYICPVEQGFAPYTVCLGKGIETRFLNYPDECHFVTGYANQLHWYRTIFGWINKYSGLDQTEGTVNLAPPISEPVRTDVEE